MGFTALPTPAAIRVVAEDAMIVGVSGQSTSGKKNKLKTTLVPPSGKTT